jgi:hypothetical protein
VNIYHSASCDSYITKQDCQSTVASKYEDRESLAKEDRLCFKKCANNEIYQAPTCCIDIPWIMPKRLGCKIEI